MMNKNFLLLTIFLIFSGNAFSQTYQLGQAVDLFEINDLRRQMNEFYSSESEIEGSPYLNDEFIKGSVYSISKIHYPDVPLRFNIYNNQIEFKNDGVIQALAAPEVIEKVEFGNYKMIYTPYVETKKIQRGFLILLEEGKASLFLKPKITYAKATEPGAYKDAEPAKFVKKANSYFIRVGKEEAKLVSNKKDLIEALSEHKEKIEAFIKKNKIKPKNQESLTELVQYYNSL